LDTGISKSVYSDYRKDRRPLKAIHALVLSWEFNICLQNPEEEFSYNLIYSRPELKHFWENIDKIFPNLEALKDFFILCELDTNLLMHNRGRNLSPNYNDLHIIALNLNCSPFLLFSNDIDTDCIRDNLITRFNKKVHIPSEFALDSGSKMRTFSHLISYSNSVLGKRLVSEILTSMQISKDAARNYNKDINIFTFEKFYSHIFKFGLGEVFIRNAGANSVNFKKNKSHFAQLLSPNTAQDVYRECIKVISSVDKNFDYNIEKITDSYCVINTRPKKLTANEKVNSGLLSRNVLQFRIGHLTALPKYFNINKGNLDLIHFSFNEKTGEAIIKIVY
jgi:hypothetical protein